MSYVFFVPRLTANLVYSDNAILCLFLSFDNAELYAQPNLSSLGNRQGFCVVQEPQSERSLQSTFNTLCSSPKTPV